MLFSSVFSIFALAAAGVNAHGYVSEIIADGKTYKGEVPPEYKKTSAPKSAIRRIRSIDPYKPPKGPGQTCGLDAVAGTVIASVTAGSTVTISWRDQPSTFWDHDMGPMLTWMAKVPAGKTAANVDASTLDFFKIDQMVFDPKNKNKWVQERLKKGESLKVVVPKQLQDGDYIMRHEIIALHLADKVGGAEFYTSCFQLKVTGGTGTAQTEASKTFKHPGAYSANDAGIHVPNLFNKGSKYTVPGGSIATFSNSGSPGTDPVNNTDTTAVPSSTKTSKNTSTSVATGKTGKPTGKPHSNRHWSSRRAAHEAPQS